MSGVALVARGDAEAGEPVAEGRLPRRAQPTISASPVERLLAEPHRFEFHQAVRLLHGLLRQLPEDERPDLRFRNTLSLSFPASELSAITVERRDGDPGGGAPAEGTATHPSAAIDRLEITPAFIGLLGATGALPLAYTEQFAQRETHGRDDTARAFLDIFQHRAVTLFHEAWRKHRLPLQFEAGRRGQYLPLILSLVGLGEPSLHRRLHAEQGGVADDALAYYAGLLQRRAVSADHLQKVLADYFDVPVRVTQLVGRWFVLEDDCQVALGESGMRLGRNTVLGPRVWQRDLCARVSIGPMDRERHKRFLPGGPAAIALRELLGLVSGAGLGYEICLGLHAADLVGMTLGDAGPGGGAGARLGWDSHLVTRRCSNDRFHAVYHLHASTA